MHTKEKSKNTHNTFSCSIEKMSENLFAEKDRVIVELVKGKEIATRLQTLMQNPVQDEEPVLFGELVLQILRSFTESLSVLSSCPELTQIPNGDGGSTCSVKKKKMPGVKDRRGQYKRRKISDSWTAVSQTTEDCWAWRKYGQKNILNSEYPRCYFRCTHKQEGCKAMKQVQQIKNEDPALILYQITYFNQHICKDSSQQIVDSDHVETNLLSFGSNTIISSTEKDLPIKEEYSQKETQSEESSLMDPWQDIMTGSDSMECKSLWNPIMMDAYHDLHGFGMENFQFDKIY